MTGLEFGLLMGLIGVLGVGGGRMWAGKNFLTDEKHTLLCKNVGLKWENKLDHVKDDIIKAIKENGNCSGKCTGQSDGD